MIHYILHTIKSSQLSCFYILFRLSSVLLVQTWFVPDEYWQSVEVAHYLAVGYGNLTWEWSQGIRSLLYPLSISIVYKQLENFGLDNPLFLVNYLHSCTFFIAD